MRKVLRAAFSVAVLMSGAAPAMAQSQPGASISGGFALPMDVANETIEAVGGDELTTGFMAPAVWAEGTVFPSARISLHTAIDLPVWSYDTHWHHVGTAGFNAHIKHYDTVVSEVVGFRPRNAGRMQLVAVVGFGLVFARSVQSTTYPLLSTSGTTATRTVHTGVNPSLVGGLNLSAAVSPRVGIMARLRTRATHRTDDSPDEHFGWFNFTPSFGITIY